VSEAAYVLFYKLREIAQWITDEIIYIFF
jgi:hypothetical protein